MDYQPAWLTDELNSLLTAIGGNDQRKKRTTVLRLAEARATGKTEAGVWEQPDCCSWKTWDGKYRKDADGVSRKRPGWRDDPAIQAALEAATRRAHWWQDQAEARRIAKRQEDVAKARDLLAEYSPLAARKLATLLGAESENVARNAANDILDRADEATASKRPEGSATAHNVTVFLPDNRRGDGPPCDEDENEGADENR
jgi:hypothetical protein